MTVVERHTQQLTDDRDWQGIGDARHEVDLARVAELVEHGADEDGVDEILHVGTEPFDAARGERLAHEAAQTRVVRWVEQQEQKNLLA